MAVIEDDGENGKTTEQRSHGGSTERRAIRRVERDRGPAQPAQPEANELRNHKPDGLNGLCLRGSFCFDARFAGPVALNRAACSPPFSLRCSVSLW